jgi:NADPH:quinone reductase-like Zn-dependent oxidoreductase
VKAIIYNKKLRPDHLVLREIEKPIPKDDEVLIKVNAVSINAADYRSMKLGIVPKKKIFGSDIAGTIVQKGTHARELNVDDEIVGDLSGCGFGGFAEYVAAPEHILVKKPTGISFETAAALPMAAVTALQALRDKGKITKGAKVLINGASGGVGSFAVQLAKYYGAEVTGVCGTDNVELVESLGADYVVDYTKETIGDRIGYFDIILAVHGKKPLGFYKKLLKQNGTYVLIGGDLSQVFASILFGPFHSIGNKKMKFLFAHPNPKDLSFILNLTAEEKIKPIIEKVYAFEDIPSAVRYVSKGHARGKQVISLAER